MTQEEMELQSFLPPSQELLSTAPDDSWVAVSADRTRILAAGPDLDSVIAKADALGEKDYILDKTPPADGFFVF